MCRLVFRRQQARALRRRRRRHRCLHPITGMPFGEGTARGRGWRLHAAPPRTARARLSLRRAGIGRRTPSRCCSAAGHEVGAVGPKQPCFTVLFKLTSFMSVGVGVQHRGIV